MWGTVGSARLGPRKRSLERYSVVPTCLVQVFLVFGGVASAQRYFEELTSETWYVQTGARRRVLARPRTCTRRAGGCGLGRPRLGRGWVGSVGGSCWEFGRNIRPALPAPLSAHAHPRCRAAALDARALCCVGSSAHHLCQMFALLVGAGANKAYYDPHMGFHKLSQQSPWVTVHGVVRAPACNRMCTLSRMLRAQWLQYLSCALALALVLALRRREESVTVTDSSRLSVTPYPVPFAFAARAGLPIATGWRN